MNGPTFGCDLPLWSEGLQILISNQDGVTLMYDPDGAVFRRYSGSGPLLNLSPSGRRLLVGIIWRDLETGSVMDFSGQSKWAMSRPAWSADEKSLFDCCYAFADAVSGQYQYFQLGELQPVGRGGTPGCGSGAVARWVSDDTRVMVESDFQDGGRSGMLPLIDPKAQTYEDVRQLAGLNLTAPCIRPFISPDGEYLWILCDSSYLIDLHTYHARTTPAGFGFESWSADSQFALLSRTKDAELRLGEFILFPTLAGDPYQITPGLAMAPSWGPQDHLAFLDSKGRTLTVLNVVNKTSEQVSLPQYCVSVYWNPQGDGLTVLAADGGLWWIPDPATDYVEQLSPPLPGVRDIRWSPQGTQIAFVSGFEVYVVSVTGDIP